MPIHEIDTLNNICIDTPYCRPRRHAGMMHKTLDPLKEFERTSRGRTIRTLPAGTQDRSHAVCQTGSHIRGHRFARAV